MTKFYIHEPQNDVVLHFLHLVVWREDTVYVYLDLRNVYKDVPQPGVFRKHMHKP